MNFKNLAVKAAKEAGKIHLKHFNTALKVGTKSRYNDKVTITDLKSEKKIVSMIRKYFPKHNILAEENKYKKTDSDYTWIIDPLDGTNNYSHNFPQFAVSIALAFKNEIILGVVYDALHKEMFFSKKGKGASLNGKKIKVTKASKIKDFMLITGFPYQMGKIIIDTLKVHERFLNLGIMGLRRLGCASMDLCYLACGRADGFWEPILQPWDFAAGKLIIEEAGGKITDMKGKLLKMKRSYVVASNGKIHNSMLKIINQP